MQPALLYLVKTRVVALFFLTFNIPKARPWLRYCNFWKAEKVNRSSISGSYEISKAELGIFLVIKGKQGSTRGYSVMIEEIISPESFLVPTSRLQKLVWVNCVQFSNECIRWKPVVTRLTRPAQHIVQTRQGHD